MLPEIREERDKGGERSFIPAPRSLLSSRAVEKPEKAHWNAAMGTARAWKQGTKRRKSRERENQRQLISGPGWQTQRLSISEIQISRPDWQGPIF